MGSKSKNQMWHDTVVVVTGGASGLGLACVEHFVKLGCKVAMLDLPSSDGASLAQAWGELVRFIPVNVCDEASLEAAIQTTQAQLGPLKVLINCAGIAPAVRTVGRDGPHDLSVFRRVIDINLTGTFNAIRLAANAMSKQTADISGNRGVIINTASAAAFDGQVGQAAYAASKAGVVGMTLPLARELARFGVRVMTVAPGIFWTPMLEAAAPLLRESLTKDVPHPPRAGKPAEFALLAQSIVENPYLNGEVIRLDGAARLSFMR